MDKNGNFKTTFKTNLDIVVRKMQIKFYDCYDVPNLVSSKEGG